MKVYLVSYNTIDWAAAYSGRRNCEREVMRYFSTKDKAEKFVNSPVYEQDPFGRQYLSKPSGEGILVEINVE